MSNITTFNDIKRNESPKPMYSGAGRKIGDSSNNNKKNDQNLFQGRAHRLDGTVVEPPKEEKKKPMPNTEPLPPMDGYEYRQEKVVVNALANIPRELDVNFWTWNLENMEDIQCKDMCLLNYCPCCVGPCCSPVRKADWCGILKRFTFWLLLFQLAYYIMTLCYSTDIGWMLEPSTSIVIKYGAMSTQKIRYDYQFWRLFTYMFLHGSWIHILFNSLGQFMFCLGCEKSWGYVRYIAIYFLSGILGGLVSAMKSANQISVGASAGIFGIMGAYAALILLFWSQLQGMAKIQLTTFLIMLPIMFICVSFLPHVDWAGHLGGVLGGIGLTFLIFCDKAEEKNRKWFILAGVIIIIICLAVPLPIIFTRK